MDTPICTFPGGMIRTITPADDAALAAILRHNLRKFHLDIPGTAYFDPEVNHLSTFYLAQPDSRTYFVAVDQTGRVLGRAGLAKFAPMPGWAELQKLYLDDDAKGRGLGRLLTQTVLDRAGQLGFRTVYLETHSNLQTAITLYEKMGFQPISRPDCVFHSTMDRFYTITL